MASARATDSALASVSSPSATGHERERLEARAIPAPPPFLFDLPPQSSDVLNRLHAFLPQIRDANMRLQQQNEGTSSGARDGDEEAGNDDEVEDHREQEEVIVLEEIESSEGSDSDSESDSDDDEHHDAAQGSKMGIEQANDDSAMAQPPPPLPIGLSHLLDIQGTSAGTDPSRRPTKALPSRMGKVTLIQEIDVGQDE
ncbi:BQ2448_3505 [Microbotryum intermedium]|uniref:BQ2448_3505 protein n=1 Tax=Microbotryum intermedium TaxID=269621 RepID=A0A238FFG2_9BASI|nr:BQ2448_3505 [Microbotryum intermedium]